MATPPREGPPFLLPVESRLIKGMTEEKGPASARSRKAPPYRRTWYHRPAQGLLLTRAPPRQDFGWVAGALGCQDRGLHLRSTDQRFPRPTVAPPGGPARIAHCTSVVSELRQDELRGR